MSAWRSFAALGLFPDCPGRGSWLALEPALDEWTLDVPGRAKLSVTRRLPLYRPPAVRTLRETSRDFRTALAASLSLRVRTMEISEALRAAQ